MKPFAKAKKQSTPVVSRSLQKFIGSVLTKGEVLIDDNTTEEVLPDKWQCEYGLCQRANTMAVTFMNATTVQKSTDSESVKKIINFTMNVNVIL